MGRGNAGWGVCVCVCQAMGMYLIAREERTLQSVLHNSNLLLLSSAKHD